MIRALITLWLCAAVVAAPAPPLQGKITGGFQAPTTVDQQGRRSVVKGMDATPQGNNTFLITQPKVTSFSATDEPEMFIDAERCLLDLRSNVAQSESKLSVRTADGRFSLQGSGWLWDPRSSYLQISNQVVAVVEKSAIETGLTNRLAASTNQPVRITSDFFQQEGDNASFIGSVHVQDGADTLRCSRLNLAFARQGGVQRIEAIQNVELVQAGTQVQSGHALYDLKENTLTITKNPRWNAGDREGSADKLVLDRASDSLIAEGDVYMKLPLTNVVTETRAPAAESADAPANARQFIEIRSGHFLYQNATSNAPASAIYRENVRALHAQGAIKADELIAGFGTGDRLTSLNARGHVEIESEGRRAFGETAHYDLANEKVSLLGNPHWEMDTRTGKSDAVIFYPKTRELFALGSVEMRLPSGSTNSLLPGRIEPATNLMMRITARSFSNQTNVSVFNDSVRIEDQRGTIDCDLLTIVTGASNQVQRIIAAGEVRISQKDLVATGARADYDTATGLVHLTGNPKLIGPDKTLTSDAFIIDRNENTFSVTPGNYRIEMKVKPGKRPFR